MPINVPDDLPAIETLRKENIFVMAEQRAFHQDIRPLRIVILNLMPDKIATETQILRLIGNTPLQVDVILIHPATHQSKTTPPEHLSRFYTTFDQIRSRKFDGLIITGAPVEKLHFEEVNYWNELKQIMDWSKKNVFSTFHICWGAQAGLYHHYGIKKYPLKRKLSGVFRHRVSEKNVKLFRGFDDVFLVPHSRHTEVKYEDISKIPSLEVLSASSQAGVYLIATKSGRQIFATGHPEYDALTLKHEYERDTKNGLDTNLPENYFPDNDISRPPLVKWRSHANLLYINWINYYVYQETPYAVESIPELD